MIKYIIAGIIQGLTEFLPVSSSGHLVITDRLLGISAGEVNLAVILHLGTCLSLLIFFFRDIILVFRDRQLLIFIGIVTLITGVIGILGEDFFEKMFSSSKLVAAALLCTGVILITTRTISNLNRKSVNAKDAVIFGLAQSIAIIPGISRSGITISSLLFRKIERRLAFRISFLASIPAILGVGLLKLKDINLDSQAQLSGLAAGFIFSFLTGLIALFALRLIIDKAKLHYFGYYCVLIALIILIFIN